MSVMLNGMVIHLGLKLLIVIVAALKSSESVLN